MTASRGPSVERPPRGEPNEGAKRAWLPVALRIVAGVGVVVLAATLRVVASGEAEIAESTAALRAGDAQEATVHARRAAGWYAPGAPHVRVAYERLIALARAAEAHGDREAALFAWRAVRAASLETRWLVTPHDDDRRRADEEIARLVSTAPRPPGTRVDPASTIAREELETLARDEAPRTPWILVLVSGVAGWIAGAVWLARRAVSASGILDMERARPAIALGVAGLVAWIVALWRA